MRKHGIFGSDKARKRQSGRFETSPFDPETHYAVIRSSGSGLQGQKGRTFYRGYADSHAKGRAGVQGKIQR